MDSAVLVAGAGLAGVVGSLLATRMTNRTTAQTSAGAQELDQQRVDGEAIERAQLISQQIADSLLKEVGRLEATIAGLVRDLASERQHSAEVESRSREVESRNRDLEAHIRDLEDSAATMRRLLERAGIEYPPPAEPKEVP